MNSMADAADRAAECMDVVFQQLDEASLTKIRKTNKFVPPRIAVLDVFAVITGLPTNGCSTLWSRLQEQYPEVATGVCSFKFPGRGQKDTDVADARTKLLLTCARQSHAWPTQSTLFFRNRIQRAPPQHAQNAFRANRKMHM